MRYEARTWRANRSSIEIELRISEVRAQTCHRRMHSADLGLVNDPGLFGLCVRRLQGAFGCEIRGPPVLYVGQREGQVTPRGLGVVIALAKALVGVLSPIALRRCFVDVCQRGIEPSFQLGNILLTLGECSLTFVDLKLVWCGIRNKTSPCLSMTLASTGTSITLPLTSGMIGVVAK